MISRRAIPLIVAVSGSLLCVQTANADGTTRCNEETSALLATEVANASDTSEAKSSSKHLTPLNKALFVGGTAAIGLGLGYAGYRYAECNGFGCASARPALDATMDVVGWGLGSGAIAVATYMYFTSGEEERQPPATIGVGQSGGLQVNFLGSF